MTNAGWLKTFCGVIALTIACGKGDAGGDSETTWLRACTSDSDCRRAGSCLCGICSKLCSDDAACASLGSPAVCASPAEPSKCATETPSSICVAWPSNDTGGSIGTGGAPSVTGGSATGGIGAGSCIRASGGTAGASSIPGVAPPDGAVCLPQHENFELCTRGNTTVLTRCTNQRWTTVEDPSACEPKYAECNFAGRAEGVCCTTPAFCGGALAGWFCDGERWWRPQ